MKEEEQSNIIGEEQRKTILFNYVEQNPSKHRVPETQEEADILWREAVDYWLGRASGRSDEQREKLYLEGTAAGRIERLLVEKGAQILARATGYPDLLVELNGEVFAIEVKGEGDYLRSHQEKVLAALKRLKGVFVVRESGEKKHHEEVTLKEFLCAVLKPTADSSSSLRSSSE